MSTFIKGDTIILYVHDGSIYRPVACLTSNSLSETRNIIESQTKCDPGVIIKDAGSYSYEISCEGQKIDTTSVGAEVTKASHDFLHDLIDAGGVETWKMDTGLTDDVAYYGTAIISDLSGDDGAGDEISTFSATLSGSGSIVKTDPEA
jgi:hypothetical protein